MRAILLLTIFAFGAAACAGVAPSSTVRPAADEFLDGFAGLCGQRYEGRIVTTDPADKDFAGKRLVMGAVECAPGEVRIPFAVGDNRSRTWVITRTQTGVRLKHVHRHDDGKEDAVSNYGGDTIAPGSATRQEFPADDFSKTMFKANKLERSLTNVWAVEVVPGRMFAYELRRPEGRFFRVEFDLTRAVPG